MTPPRRARACFGAALLWVAGSVSLHAQTGAITGIVRDKAGTHLANVEVSAPKLSLITHTDSLGRFKFLRLAPGTFDVSFRRLSYTPLVVSLEVTPGDTTDVDLTLDAAAEALPTVVVQGAKEHSRDLDGFEDRRRQGLGHYVTRADIQNRDPLLLSDMMRTVPGTMLTPTNILGRMVLKFSRSPSCTPNYFIDGLFVPNFNIDDMPVRDVEGIELYAGFAGLPGQFAKQMPGSKVCGTVVIWTRIPGKAD